MKGLPGVSGDWDGSAWTRPSRRDGLRMGY
jgi:hypothetical protein